MANGAPNIPSWIAAERLRFVTLRSIEAEAGMEGETFVFLTDANKWAVETEADAATIRAALPEARVVVRV
jgi:hypothetical protein